MWEQLVNDGVAYLSEIAESDPAIKILAGLAIVDVLLGWAVSSVVAKNLSSSASLRGMTKKLAMFLMVFVCKVIEPIMQLQLGTMAALFYCGTELISITENARDLGLPIPKVVTDALDKFRRNNTDTVMIPAQPLRTSKRPSDYVDLPQHVPKDPKGTADQEGGSQPGRPGQTGNDRPLNVQDKRSTQNGGSEK